MMFFLIINVFFCLSPLINWTNLIIQFRTLILGCYEQITKKIQFRREASDYS